MKLRQMKQKYLIKMFITPLGRFEKIPFQNSFFKTNDFGSSCPDDLDEPAP